MQRSRLPDLLAEHLGPAADPPRILAIAGDVRDELGELAHLDQADPDALADIVGRHVPPVALPTTQCEETCAGGGCSAQCFLPSGHDGGRHRCQAHFLDGV